MHIEKLTFATEQQWATLLALCFERSPDDMLATLHWLSTIGSMEAYGAWNDDKLVAQYACLLRTVIINQEHILVGMSANMAVHPDYRGRGIIKQVSLPVYNIISQLGGKLGLGFSNAEGVKVDRNSKGYGYQVIGQMQSIIGMFKDFCVQPLTLTESLPESALFADDIQPSSSAYFHKNYDYLYKRYASHPSRNYQFAIWEEANQILGMVVYRPVSLMGLPAIALLDAYGCDVGELLKRWSGTMEGCGQHIFHVLLSPNSHIKALLKQHWMIAPLPYTRTPYFLTAKPLQDNLPDSIFDFKQWDLIGGDIL